MGYTEKIVVVGAGISGLACAYRLKQLGLCPLVLEAAEKPGGLVSTIRKNGYLFETGPQFPRFPAALWGLVRELGLESEFVAGNPKANRYIFRNGHLHPAPFSPAGLISSRLVGIKSKYRILTEVFHKSQAPLDEESLAQFVERKFGSEVLDNLVDPVVATIFFGDSEKMGMVSAFPDLVKWEQTDGSLVRGALRSRRSKNVVAAHADINPERKGNVEKLRVTDQLPTLGSFVRGMGTLTEALAEDLGEQIQYRVVATSLSQSAAEAGQQNQFWEIELSSGAKIQSENVVLATPAFVSSQLLQTSSPGLALQLSEIEYAATCVVCCVYDRSQIRNSLDGFGFMVPRREGLNTICTFWNSSLFAGRAPEGKVLITSFAASRDGHDIFAVPEERCAQMIHNENAAILGIRDQPADWLVWRDARALPQYNVGHKQRIEQIHRNQAQRLSLIGNYLKGRSLGECVQLAFECAEELYGRFQN